jgi:hypothetical protein
MSRMEPPDDCWPAAPPPSIELSKSLSGLLVPPPPPRIEPSGSSTLLPPATSSGSVVPGHYCGRADILQALGPGWIGLRTDRQYADQPVRAGAASSWRFAVNRLLRTVITAASSSSVGEPLTTENTGC